MKGKSGTADGCSLVGSLVARLLGGLVCWQHRRHEQGAPVTARLFWKQQQHRSAQVSAVTVKCVETALHGPVLREQGPRAMPVMQTAPDARDVKKAFCVAGAGSASTVALHEGTRFRDMTWTVGAWHAWYQDHDGAMSPMALHVPGTRHAMHGPWQGLQSMPARSAPLLSPPLRPARERAREERGGCGAREQLPFQTSQLISALGSKP